MILVEKINGLLKSDAGAIWKVALTLMGWLLMGTWMAARISAGNEALREDLRMMRVDVHTISQRLDVHIDNTRKDK